MEKNFNEPNICVFVYAKMYVFMRPFAKKKIKGKQFQSNEWDLNQQLNK